MVRSSCFSASIIGLLAASSAFAQTSDGPASRAARSQYAVDGIALGARIDAQSPAYRGYQCSPSEQFPEFTRCSRTQRQQAGFGRRGFDATSSILHGADGRAVYINHYNGPWVFDRGEIQTEINRLSGRFGERAREMRLPQQEGLPYGIIAAWGQVQLEPLDASAVAVLASGESPRKGLLIDYLGDLRRSAQLGLPIFSIHGGAGYLWSASADHSARGHMRFLTVDAAAFSPATEKPQPSPEAGTQASTAEITTPEMPQGQRAATPGAPEQANVDSEVAKTETAQTQVENAPILESAAANTNELVQASAPEGEKVEARLARLEAQLARVEAANRKLETWGYRGVAGLLVFLIASAMLLRAWRRKTRAMIAAAASKASAEPATSLTAAPQVEQQSAPQSSPTLVPADPSPLPIIADMDARPTLSAPAASHAQSCTSCHGAISPDDKFCKHCGTAVSAAGSIAVLSASASMAVNGEAH